MTDLNTFARSCWLRPCGHMSGGRQGHADPHGRPGKVDSGKAWFAEKDGKLIGYIDIGMKCDSEVTLRADGFDMEVCFAGDKRFVRSGNEFKATFGSYIHTIRPVP
jgi:hypothetical protein